MQQKKVSSCDQICLKSLNTFGPYKTTQITDNNYSQNQKTDEET